MHVYAHICMQGSSCAHACRHAFVHVPMDPEAKKLRRTIGTTRTIRKYLACGSLLIVYFPIFEIETNK
jgi:hypothetical protein